MTDTETVTSAELVKILEDSVQSYARVPYRVTDGWKADRHLTMVALELARKVQRLERQLDSQKTDSV